MVRNKSLSVMLGAVVSSDHPVPWDRTWVCRRIQDAASKVAFLEQSVRIYETGEREIVFSVARNYQLTMDLN